MQDLKDIGTSEVAMEERLCYLCNEAGHELPLGPDTKLLTCANCMMYSITNDVIEKIGFYWRRFHAEYHPEIEGLVRLKQLVHKMLKRNELIPHITESDVKNAFDPDDPGMVPSSPDIFEQRDRLVCLIVEEDRKAYGKLAMTPKFEREGMKIGSFTETDFAKVLQMVRDDGLMSEDKLTKKVSSSFEAEKYYEQLKNRGFDGDTVFMAMAFGEDDLNKAKKHFKAAVERSGFKLVFADEIEQMGLIDKRIRDAIRASAFVIADLSHGNQGAYFEAGCADGQGKPVIYTCNKNKWDDPEAKKANVHFDVNHYRIIRWDPENLQAFESALETAIKDVVREFTYIYAT